jgi:hypothetical protein
MSWAFRGLISVPLDPPDWKIGCPRWFLRYARAKSAQGLAHWLSPGLPEVAFHLRVFGSLCRVLVQFPWGMCVLLGQPALRVGLFGEVLSLQLSGLDLFCKARAILRACQHLEGDRPQGGSIQPLSFQILSPG